MHVCVLRSFTCARGYVSLSPSLPLSLSLSRSLSVSLSLALSLAHALSLLSLSLAVSLSLARARSLSRSLCGIALQEDVAEYDRKEGERVPNTTRQSLD